jgi:hypothetical protein
MGAKQAAEEKEKRANLEESSDVVSVVSFKF